MADTPPTGRSGGNPFVLPPSGEVFRLHEAERSTREAERRATLNKPIWDKSEYSSTMSSARRAIAALAPDVDPSAARKARRENGLIAAATTSLSGGASAVGRGREKESLKDFVANKREMFMLQMQIDLKKGEISALERSALAAEEELQAEEDRLEQDAARFDAFLKESDSNVSEADASCKE